MDFHKRLRKIHADSGLSLKAIGEACSVSYQTVQQWMKDDGTYPKIENLEPLAGVLKTTPWYLLFGIHAGGESPIKGPFIPLSDEADELIQCVTRFDAAGDRARKTFALYTELMLLAFNNQRSEDAQAGLNLPSSPEQTDSMLDAGIERAREVLARDLPSGDKHAAPKRSGS